MDVYMLVDCSWSTEHLKKSVVDYIHILDKTDLTYEIYTFTSTIDLLSTNQCVKDYDIGGRTCLYDSIGELVHMIDKLTPHLPPDIIVWTDGDDTGSVLYTHGEIQALINVYIEKGWRFTFLYKNPFRLKTKEYRCC
jgi:hypothetical protein